LDEELQRPSLVAHEEDPWRCPTNGDGTHYSSLIYCSTFVLCSSVLIYILICF
jgi:hypothetical protein